MYQLEIKRWLVHWQFPPSAGWRVHVDIDAMERANGGKHPSEKAERAAEAELALMAHGIIVGAHATYGRADVVAEHPALGVWLIEVEGQSTRQREQALYSAIGQLVLQMVGGPLRFAVAVPDEPKWEHQIRKVPAHARSLLDLKCFMVSPLGVREA